MVEDLLAAALATAIIVEVALMLVVISLILAAGSVVLQDRGEWPDRGDG